MNDLVSKESSIRFTWEHVATLSDAKDLLREVPFDIILLDLSLSDRQGLDTFIHLYPRVDRLCCTDGDYQWRGSPGIEQKEKCELNDCVQRYDVDLCIF